MEPQRATRIGPGLAVEVIDRAQHAVADTVDIRVVPGWFGVDVLAVEVAVIVRDQRELDVRHLESSHTERARQFGRRIEYPLPERFLPRIVSGFRRGRASE